MKKLIFGSIFFVASQSFAAVDAGINEVGNSIALITVSHPASSTVIEFVVTLNGSGAGDGGGIEL